MDLKVKKRNLSFSEALIELKSGELVSREGWNGKGMFLVVNGGYEVDVENIKKDSQIPAEFVEARGCKALQISRHIDMWTADNKLCVGWLSSQTDMMAEDWCVIEFSTLVKEKVRERELCQKNQKNNHES